MLVFLSEYLKKGCNFKSGRTFEKGSSHHQIQGSDYRTIVREVNDIIWWIWSKNKLNNIFTAQYCSALALLIYMHLVDVIRCLAFHLTVNHLDILQRAWLSTTWSVSGQKTLEEDGLGVILNSTSGRFGCLVTVSFVYVCNMITENYSGCVWGCLLCTLSLP